MWPEGRSSGQGSQIISLVWCIHVQLPCKARSSCARFTFISAFLPRLRCFSSRLRGQCRHSACMRRPRAATIRLRRGLQLWRNCTRGRRRSCRRERRGRLTPAGSNGAEHKADGLARSAGQAAPAKAAGYLRSEPATPVAPETSHLPMKIFFLLASVSLLISTLTGI
jgi:hypothetical protein